jgi:hypothetical protein
LIIFWKDERSHGLHFIPLLYALQNGLNHGLSKENLKKFQISCKFMQLLWMKIINYCSEFFALFVIGIVLLTIYIRQDYNFHFIPVLIIYLLAIFVTIKTLSSICLSICMGYSLMFYLRLRFQQITKQFERITNKNLNSLEALIRAQNTLTVMTKDCDKVCSKLLGVFYFYAPFIVNLLLVISIYGNSLIYVRFVFAIYAVFTVIGLYLCAYTPAQVSTEAHRCYNTINSINTSYKIPLQTKLKVRSFLGHIRNSFENFVSALILRFILIDKYSVYI